MKKLLFAFCMMFFAVGFSTLEAQTTCTPAQKEACKKICSTNVSASASCTVAQKAACQKVCNNNASTKTVSNIVPKVLFAKVSSKDAKATICCASKLAKGETKSCAAKKPKVVKNETAPTTPIAQE